MPSSSVVIGAKRLRRHGASPDDDGRRRQKRVDLETPLALLPARYGLTKCRAQQFIPMRKNLHAAPKLSLVKAFKKQDIHCVRESFRKFTSESNSLKQLKIIDSLLASA